MMDWDWVIGRGPNYIFQLKEVWTRLETSLLAAETDEEITAAFKENAEPYATEFVPRLASDILLLIRDPKFPQRAKARIKFLAHSLAGRPALSFRTSRDICEKAQTLKKLASPHRILWREFYIECSCGYQGPARDNACRNCGALPSFSFTQWTGQAPSDIADEPEETIPKPTQREVSQEIAVPTTAEPNHVVCDLCGATTAAADRNTALKTLAEHKRVEHGVDPESSTRNSND